MLQHYISSAYRQMKQQRLISVLNLVGLSLGLSACLTLILYIQAELSWDTQWGDVEGLYAATRYDEEPGRAPRHGLWTDGLMLDDLDTSLNDQIAMRSRLYDSVKTLAGDFKNQDIFFAGGEANLLEILQPKVLFGADTLSLEDPSHLWLTKTAAERLFKKADARGESLLFENGRSFKIVGILEDLPKRSHLEFEAVAKLQPIDLGPNGAQAMRTEGYMAFVTYVRFQDGVDPAKAGRQVSDHFNARTDGFVPSLQDSVQFIKVRDLHLADGLSIPRPKGNAQQLAIFSALALVILIIAAVNFMNMGVVRATARARETAMRRVLGANSGSVASQFLIETGINIMIAVALALVIADFSLPPLSALIGVDLSLTSLTDPAFMILIAGVVLIAILLAGLYPAVLSARIRPAESMSMGRTVPHFVMRFSQALLVLQFVTAISLVAMTLLLSDQMTHLRTLDRGFDRFNVLTMNRMNKPQVETSRDAFRQAVLNDPLFTDAGFSWTDPGVAGRSVFSIRIDDSEKGVMEAAFTGRYIDPYYFDVLKMTLLAGRTYVEGAEQDIRTPQVRPQDDDRGDDEILGKSIIVSLSAANQLGFETAEDAIGGKAALGGGNNTIIGVVNDIFVDADAIGREPTIYLYEPQNYNRLNVRYTGDPQAAIARLKEIWQQFYPDVTSNIHFLDELVDRRYRTQDMETTLFTIFSSLAVFVSLIGLFGMSAFQAARREKEVSLRKVFGADLGQILIILGWQFARPVLIASLIAWPVIYVVGTQWLHSFSERIGLTSSLFILPTLAALALALLTVSGNAFMAARQRPAQVFRQD